MLKPRHTQDGFSMIEVLIALLVISVGFLATARMQIQGLRSSQGAYFTSQANFMAREMADRIRTNPEGIQAGEYNDMATSAAAAANMPSCIAAETLCSASDIADADLAAWSQYLYASSEQDTGFIPLLPSGDNVSATGSVSADGGGRVFTVSVNWSVSIDGVEEARTISVQVYP